jgi:hypothetical protein
VSHTEGKQHYPNGRPDIEPLEVVVELSFTEKRLADNTIGLATDETVGQGVKVCFMRQHGLGTYMKMVGDIRMVTERDKKYYAIVHLDQRPEVMLRKVNP